MRRAHAIAVGLGWVALGAAVQGAPEGRFGWLGLAPVEAGQTLAQAEAALGAALQPEAPAGQDAARCHLRSTPARPGVAFVVDQGRVTRTETRDPRYPTVRGVRVGDPVKRVREIYGARLEVRPHAYFERGLMLSVYSPDRKFALVMESNDAGRLVMLRGGMVPAVESLAGCSA